MPKHPEMTPDQRRVAEMISRLDYRLPPGDFTSAVMVRIPSNKPKPSDSRSQFWLKEVVCWLITPRPWRIAPAAPLGVVIGVMLLVIVSSLGDSEGPLFDRVKSPGFGEQSELNASSDTHQDGVSDAQHIVFTVLAAGARNVALIGTFNNWRNQGYEMRPVDQHEGLWTITVSLEQGRYEYAFLLNGERIMDDPQALLFKEDGFGNRNSVIIVEDYELVQGYS